MKIIHYFHRIDLEQGGTVRAVLDVCELLACGGHDVVLITWDQRDVPKAWRSNGHGTPRVAVIDPPDRPLGLFGRAALDRLRRLIEQADVLHLHTPWDTANPQLARLAGQVGTPFVLTVHGMLDDWQMRQKGAKKRLYLALRGRQLLESARFIHCTATSEQHQASRWYRHERSRVIPCVFDLSPFRVLPGPEIARRTWPEVARGEPVLLFLSRLHYKKGVEVLISAAADLRRRGSHFRLVMAGAGDDAYLQRLKRQVKEHGLEDVTTFTGMVTGDRKLSLYQASDVFMLPTSQENFGLVFPETLACQTPAITTRGVDIWQELEESGGVLVVDRTPQAFADAAAQLLDDPNRRTDMGHAGRAWVFRTFDDDRILGQFLQMYCDAVTG